MHWPLTTFLDRARITQNGQITRAALLLLGKPEAVWHLSPHPVQITWKLDGAERAYQHFAPPFLLTTTQLYQRIRNIQLRLLPQDELLPLEVSKYDQKIVLEALHNCLAHQDYTRNGRVTVIEQPDRLVFENEGNFFDGTPGDYLEGNRVPQSLPGPSHVRAEHDRHHGLWHSRHVRPPGKALFPNARLRPDRARVCQTNHLR